MKDKEIREKVDKFLYRYGVEAMGTEEEKKLMREMIDDVQYRIWKNTFVDFISRTLSADRARVIKIIESKKISEESMKGMPFDDEMGYNQALDDIKAELEKEDR